MRRTALAAAALVALEAYLYTRYASFGALFHFFVHGLAGAGLGLVLAAIPDRPLRSRAWWAAVGGHLFSAAPDVLFLAVDWPHEWWMDVFFAHVSVHFVPAPVAVSVAVFVLGLGAVVARGFQAGRAVAVMGIAGVVVLVGALVLRAPMPSTLSDIRERPGLVLWCPLDGQRYADAGA